MTEQQAVIPPVVVRDGRIAIPESWLAERRDDSGFLSLDDAILLRDALHDAVNDEIVHQRQPWKLEIVDRGQPYRWETFYRRW